MEELSNRIMGSGAEGSAAALTPLTKALESADSMSELTDSPATAEALLLVIDTGVAGGGVIPGVPPPPPPPPPPPQPNSARANAERIPARLKKPPFETKKRM